jgi:hypothetical protein
MSIVISKGGAEMVRQLHWKWFELVLNRKWFDKVYQHEIAQQTHWKWVDTFFCTLELVRHFFLLTGNGSTLFLCLLEMDQHIFLIITG